MNIAEILKNKPKGFEFYSVQYGYVNLLRVESDGIIIYYKDAETEQFWVNKNGKLKPEGEVLIFPSKENRDWNSLIQFKKGDIIANKTCPGLLAVFDHLDDKGYIVYSSILYPDDDLKVITSYGIGSIKTIHQLHYLKNFG